MDISVIYNFRLLLWQSFLVTLQLSALSIVSGTVLGFITCLARMSHFKWLSAIAKVYIEIFRGSPLLMQFFMFYFGLPYLGQALLDTFPGFATALLSLSQFTITMLVFTLYTGAYIAEIFRSGFQSIPRGQFEAASSLGLGYFRTIEKVVLPQIVKIVYPPLVGFYIGLVKDTSLASIIGYKELVKQGQSVINTTNRPFEIYITVAILYFIICYPLSKLVQREERRQVA